MVPRVVIRKVFYTLTESDHESESDIANKVFHSIFNIKFTMHGAKYQRKILAFVFAFTQCEQSLRLFTLIENEGESENLL